MLLSPHAAASIALLGLGCAAGTSMTPTASPARADPHSYARPDEARVTHLALDWTVDFDERTLRGSATLTLERAAGAEELVLDARELTVEDVHDVDGVPLAFTVDRPEPVLGDRLRVRLEPATRAVRIEYATSPGATGLLWLEPVQTHDGDAPYVFSQAQAIHARSFMPCQDSPGVRFTYEACVRVPPGLNAVMSAERRPVRDEDPPGSYRFALERPVPAYLVAIAVGRIEFKSVGPRTGVWAEPGVVNAAAHEFEDLEKMLAAIEGMFGPYRWGRYEVLVLPPSFPFGGMENPIVTFATPTVIAGDRSLVNVIAHELAHSWSGNLVTNATWNDFWLNEGFTVYLENRILERLYGERAAVQNEILGRTTLLEELAGELEDRPADQRLVVDLAGRDPDDGATAVPYEKGALFLLMLERATGRERFDAFLREWFDEHAFQSATSAELERLLRTQLLASDERRASELMLDAWLRGPGLPLNSPELDESVFAASDRAAEAFLAGTLTAERLGADVWTTNEWLRFLKRLPQGLEPARMAELDQAWSLTERGNAEIAAVWLEHAIRAGYAPADARLEEFLVTIGRRKYLKPLYVALCETPAGRERARKIFERARQGYHAIARKTIEDLLAAG